MDSIKFDSHTLLVPALITDTMVEYKMYFVSAGTTISRKKIFAEVFPTQATIKVIPLLDIDIENPSTINEAITHYEDNSVDYKDSIYEIARMYH